MTSLSPLEAAGLALGLASIAYLVLALRGVLRFQSRADLAPAVMPGITILKPVCGVEAGLRECLRSFCVQDYPVYQVVFGVSDPADPAMPIIRGLIAEFPERDLSVVVDRGRRGANPKISNLINMYAAAKHPVLLISDSDVQVDRRCLAAMAAPLASKTTGAVTCLYKGISAGGLASELGALFINDWFVPSVLVDTSMHEIDFCFGPVSAVRREALEAIGGLESLAPHLADDYMLGQMVSRAGYKVELSDYLVSTVVDEPDFAALFRHELRWAHTVRTCRPLDHWLSLVTQALPLTSLLLLVPEPSIAGAVVVVTAIGLRLAVDAAVRRKFGVARPRTLWLVPLRECLCFAVWAASLFGRRVRWRGHDFAITSDGTLIERRPERTPLRPALADAYSEAQSPTA